ncbi:MAG: hypothetical protein ABFC96_06200 [Thermoguttaceae bacterium]
MKRFVILAIAAAMLAAWGWADKANAGYGSLKGRVSYHKAQTYPWHYGYYDVAWGTPVAVVVPPTAETQSHYAWGVGATRVTPIRHQFQKGYPGPEGPGARCNPFCPTPRWPASTDQFGDYYIRGPW